MGSLFSHRGSLTIANGKTTESTAGIVAAADQDGAESVVAVTASATDVRRDEREDKELLCGYGRWKPACLQPLHRAWCLLVVLCASSVAQGMLINGFVPVSISTLEQRFYLTSTQSGVYIAMYDIAVVLSLIFVCHYGGKGHKGHWLGVGMLFLGLGALVCTIPQYVVGLYRPADSDSSRELCNAVKAGSSLLGQPQSCSSTGESYLSNYFYVLLLGQFLNGVGAAPLYTLGVTYIDENVAQKSSPLYLGIFFALAVVGPAIGFTAGGAFLKIPGDIGKAGGLTAQVDNYNQPMTDADPRWYGAWWIGYLSAGALALLCSVPLLGFATELPEAKHHRSKDINQAYAAKGSKKPSEDLVDSGVGFDADLRDLPKACLRLFKNPTFTLLVVMQVFEGFLLSGMTNFVPKIMENLFSLPSSTASMITGAVVVPGGALGNVLGGALIKRLRLRCAGIIMLAIVAEIIAFFLIFVFFVQCEQPPFAGDDPTQRQIILPRSCNTNCSCSPQAYNPSCASNLVYYSPCYAGCTTSSTGHTGPQKQYSNCSCLALNVTAVLNPGICPSNCNLMPLFLVFLGFLVLATFTAAIPVQQAMLRCVNFNERNLAIGLTSIMVRVFGSVPGAILFGKAIDEACIFWQSVGAVGCVAADGDQRVCVRYDASLVSAYVMAFAFTFKFVVVVTLAVAWKCYRRAAVGDSSAMGIAVIAAEGASSRNGAHASTTQF